MLRQFPHTLISSLALSPDGQTLAIGMLDSPVVHLWDCDGRFIRRTLAGHTQWINSLVFSPDGKWLLTGANDETARLWDSESGKCRAILMGHTGAITSVAYAPGRLLTGSIDYTAHLWDEEMARGTQQVCALNASPANGTALQTLFAMNGTTGSGLSFAEQKRVYFAPGGASALVFDERNAELWNTEKRTCLVSMSMRTIEWLKYSLDGHYLLIGRPRGLRAYRCIDGKVEENGGYKQWDEYLAPALPLTHPPGEPISVTTADLRYRISASHQGRLICEKIALPPTNSTEQMVETEAVCITHLSFSPGEQFLLVSNTAGRLFFFAWDGNAIGSLLGLYQVYGQVAGLSWLSHDRLILADIGPGLLPHFHRLHLEDIWR